MESIDYYSEKEDIRFSNLVLYFNSLSVMDNEREVLMNKIKDRTQILIYSLCLRNLFLTEDEATEVYLDLRQSIEKIIASYTICSRTYNVYILQICRHRSYYLARRKFDKDRLHEGLLKEIKAEYEYRIEDTDLLDIITEREPYYSTASLPEIEDMNLRELCSYIIENKDDECSLELNDKELMLSEAVENKLTRRYMLYYLMWLPQVETTTFIESIARVLGLDTAVISLFYSLRFDYLEDKHERWSKRRDIANRHYGTMIKIRSKKFYEDDNAKIDALEKDYKRAQKRFLNANEISRKAALGLSQAEISEILGIKRSVVGYGLARFKEIITEIANSKTYKPFNVVAIEK